MNIGGNNLGFGNIIQRCLNLPPFVFDPCSPRRQRERHRQRRHAQGPSQTGVGSGEPEHVIGLDDLPGLYSELNNRINRRAGAAGS